MAGKENVFSFIWKIDSFSMLPYEFKEELDSPTFVMDTCGKTEFVLRLYPRGYIKKDNISIFLCKEQEDEQDFKLNFSLTIESTELSREITKEVRNQAFKQSNGFPNFVSLSEVFSNKQLYLPQDTLTLRCDISPIQETSADSTENKEPKSVSTMFKKMCIFRTWVDVHRRSITWSIRNIKKITQRLEEDSVTTPYLKLTMAPNKKEIPGHDYIRILIQQTSLPLDGDRLFVRCKITLISARRQCQAFEESTHLFESDSSDVWTFKPFITRSMLIDKNNHFENDTLILLCEFAFSYQNKVYFCYDNYMPLDIRTGKINSRLSTCLENIYADSKYCDIELKAGGKTFPYYKVVLCARSPVFGAMFENNLQEKNSNVVEIDDVDADTVQRMLTYMHSDVLEEEDLSPEDIGKLYAAADKYEIGPLKESCAALLMSELSVGRVCEILVLADDHQDGLLMTAACDFISSHANEVFHSTQWESLMIDHLKLASSVMHKIWKEKF